MINKKKIVILDWLQGFSDPLIYSPEIFQKENGRDLLPVKPVEIARGLVGGAGYLHISRKMTSR